MLPPAEPVESPEALVALARYERERRRATQDGLIWPFARAAMASPAAIIARMVEDVCALRRKHGFASAADLASLGWRPDQIRDHALLATQEAVAPCATGEVA